MQVGRENPTQTWESEAWLPAPALLLGPGDLGLVPVRLLPSSAIYKRRWVKLWVLSTSSLPSLAFPGPVSWGKAREEWRWWWWSGEFWAVGGQR